MLRWHMSMGVMCHLWGLYCLIEPMVYSHVAISVIWSAKVYCCCVAMWHWVLRWLCHGLPCGMLVGPTCQVSIVVRPTWLRWTNEVLPRGTFFLSLILRVQHVWNPQFAPRSVAIPILYPERPWSNLSPLICLFNLFYRLWFYSDSSTCPKIMKFSP
jgi:hypothetical protein